jgi:hypothetical protein
MLIEFFTICIVICIAILLFSKNDEQYDPNFYNYEKENPHALQSGKIIAGTVYSDYPDKIPGLGWLL